MRSGNPALNEKTFDQYRYGAGEHAAEQGTTMTVQGTAIKTGMLLLLAVVAASITWKMYFDAVAAGNTASMMPWVLGGAIGGLVVALVTIFKPTWSPVTAPIYALLEGLFLGAISAMYYNVYYPGIVLQAVCLTFGTMFTLLVAYQTGWIRATENFKLGIVAATGGIFLVYMLTMVLSFFGLNIPYIHGSGMIGIGFSLFVVVIAALNLVLDFDFIETGAERGAPKFMEWYGAFGLMVTLVWLYLEILRLLAKISSRD